MAALMVAGAVLLVSGAFAILYGLQIKEFSFGGTLILSGTTVACTAVLLFGVSALMRELNAVRRVLENGGQAGTAGAAAGVGGAAIPNVEPIIPDADGSPRIDSRGDDTPLIVPDAPGVDERHEPVLDMTSPDTPPAQKPRRNLLFSSTSRKERERAAARASEPGSQPGELAAGTVLTDAPPVTFDQNWSGAAVPRDPAPPAPRPSAAPMPALPQPASPQTRRPQPDPTPQITVLKSGVVDGMAYSLYSDGSIEAQLPEGMMRFTSIDDLRSYLDSRA